MGRGQELLDAAREGDRRTVEKLIAQITKRSGPFPSIKRGPGINVQDANGYTPLHHACLNGHKEVVQLLLAGEASPCHVDKEGATPLHLAAFKGCSEVVRMLLAHRTPPVNIDQLTRNHDTALLIAAQFGFVDIVSQLIACGADVTLRNKDDESALDLAARYGRLDTVKHLLKVRPHLVDPYKGAPMRESIILGRCTTPLHVAAKHGQPEVVEVLIDAGIDPNIRTTNGTPLHEAVRYARAQVVEVLLKKGADLMAKDKGKNVHDLLAEHREGSAVRHLREIIREYISHNQRSILYDSEEDVPPFPPVHDYSPTAPMKAPETQKISNKNDSLLTPPPSSLTKSHPQSFVKKLASKCLGLKAKFNSAPNISNNTGTDSEDVTSKSTNQKSNTNTLLIGNSKFFKRLSKKEESGEIVCNDEFDTISLDRLGTLNRDSVVNRSNRSCPGFKTSLPNISENNELSDHESIPESVIITELDCDKSDTKINISEAINLNPIYNNINIFEPRERTSIISNVSAGSAHLINECYESYEFDKTKDDNKINSFPRPFPRPIARNNNDINMIYENVANLNQPHAAKPTPAARIHLPSKVSAFETEKKVLYENVTVLRKPEPPKRTFLPQIPSNGSEKDNSRSVSRSSTLSSDSMIDESNLEDILLSQKSKSFKHGQLPSFYSDSYKSDICRTQSNASDSSDATDASAIENVDCSADATDKKALYMSMTGTLPNKKSNTEKKKVLFRHKTFTNMEVDRNSIKVKDLPQWNNEFLKETLASYHIRGTGHCIYSAPTVQEFIDIFNRETLYKDVPFTRVPNDKRDSYFETAICFCRPRPPKHHNSAEDLLERAPQKEERVFIDINAVKTRQEHVSASFKCFCDSGACTFHSNRRESIKDLVVKFSAIKRSISTPDITLDPSFSTVPRTNLPKNYSVPHNFEQPYAVVDIIKQSKPDKVCDNDNQSYTTMSYPSTLTSSASRMYSIKDIAEVISLNKSSSSASTLSNASDLHLSVRKSSSSEYSGKWSLQSCNSNVTIKSDASFKSCLEESSEEDTDGTLHSDDESDTETIKSDISTAKRPWVHSDSFRFGGNTKPEIETITEESQSSFEEKFESMSSKFESGISVEGSESSSSGGEDDSGIPRGGDVSLGASLERGSVSGGVRSGSGRRRWDELEGMSEGDALSLSSATSSCAPLHLAHYHDYSKVSPTPPKKPPRRNLSVSPTHANSPSSGYSYELRVHARSQDDLDDLQGAKHYLKHGRSVDHYVDSKLSYSEYEENHNSPRVAPIPNPRPSLKQRSQPVAITAMYENVVIKEQNPRRKLRRNNFNDSYDQRMNPRKYSHQERSSLESLLDDQSMNSPSDCDRYYEGPRADVPLSPTHYEQPPTPDHPPPSARQAENSIHERIRPLSQLIMEVVEEIRIRKKSQGDIKNS